jgi:hypothetical protein
MAEDFETAAERQGQRYHNTISKKAVAHRNAPLPQPAPPHRRAPTIGSQTDRRVTADEILYSQRFAKKRIE